MSDYGIKVMAAGHDITEAKLDTPPFFATYPSPHSMNFYSGWFVYKVVASGTLSGSVGATGVGGGTASLTVAHSLGYAPMVGLFFSIDGGTTWWMNNSETQGSTTGTPMQVATAQSTSSNITVEIFGVSMGAYNISCRYLIYAEQGS